MALAWFLAPLIRRVGRSRPTVYCQMDDFTAAIRADGGDWTESEVLGGMCVVKVRANAATLTSIANTAGITRLPLTRLDDSLSTLTTNQRTAIRQKALDMGYTAQEIADRFPNLAQATLGDVLRFLATRRRKARYDQASDTVVWDGDILTPRSIDDVDAGVQ